MRLGGDLPCFRPRSAAELSELAETLDTYGLSATYGPAEIESMDEEACAAFGEKVRQLGMVIGEYFLWANPMTHDAQTRDQVIERIRKALRKCDRLGGRCLVTLVGSRHPNGAFLAPHPYMYTDACKREFREFVLRILDGLDLQTVRYGIEPWHNSFFYQPEEIRAFIDRVGHPHFGLHLDQMNMVSQRDFFDTTALIKRTFELLSDRVWSVHLKDIQCDSNHMFLKYDEVFIGEGVMDYATYLRCLAGLPRDTTCYVEHLKTEGDYALSFARLHQLAAKAGVRFLRRGE